MFVKSKEELLKNNDHRFTLFPITYPDVYALYKKALASFWVVEEIDFSIDLDHWDNRLNNDERFFIKNVLAFFSSSDGIVNENLAINFYNEIQVPEVRALYSTQIQIETVHSECYSLMIDTYIKDQDEKNKLFKAIEFNNVVAKKADWALKWVTSGTFPERLLAFIAIEGVFFSGSFAAIYWLKSRDLMPGLSLANQFISRDESLHCRTGVLLYNKLSQKLNTERVHSLFKEAYSIEEEFITKSLPVSLIGMNSNSMKQYIKFVIDYWLIELGYPKLFGDKNPFSFMEYISLENKTNFFERRVSEYSKISSGNQNFSLDADF
jgi:ribonucleoside-diphosphate reductase beta chain